MKFIITWYSLQLETKKLLFKRTEEKKARVNAEMNSNKLMDENREQFPSKQVQRILLSEKASLKKICAKVRSSVFIASEMKTIHNPK